jgi:hypothetical protein
VLKLFAIVLLSLSLFTVGLLASSSCVVVDVKTAEGPRIIVPVPLVVARTAMAFAPEEARHVGAPELAEYSELASRVVDELEAIGDGVLVEVERPGEHVVIEKVGDELVIDAANGEQDVLVHLPLEALAEILESYDGRDVDVVRVMVALSSISNRDLVHVKTSDEEVKVWIW